MLFRFMALSCALVFSGLADTLYLRSGATIQGNFAGGDTRQVKMMTGDRVESYSIDDVLRLEFGAGSTGAAPASRENREQPAPAVERDLSGVEIPASTNLVIRLIDSVDSERDHLGQTFRASIDEPVEVDGLPIISRGADAVVKLVEDKESGKFTGKTVLTLALESVKISGRMREINTSEVSQASGSRTVKTAATVGGGAAGGAVLGGLLGGGKGAAIGAVSGGGLGAGAEVLTKGQKVKIPSETRLSFLLQQPVRL